MKKNLKFLVGERGVTIIKTKWGKAWFFWEVCEFCYLYVNICKGWGVLVLSTPIIVGKTVIFRNNIGLKGEYKVF